MAIRGIKEDPPRSGRYVIRFKDQHGKDHREWFDSLEEANAARKLRLVQVQDGTYRPEMSLRHVKAKQAPMLRTGSRLVADVIDEVVAEARVTLRDVAYQVRSGDLWKAELGTRTLEQVQLEDVQRWRRRNIDRLAPATLNKYVMFLHKVYSHALANGYTTHNPLRGGGRTVGGYRPLVVDNEQTALLLPEQQAALAAVMRPADYRIVCLAIETGMRAGNLFGMRREWVDLKRQVVRVPATAYKGKRVHLVRLNSMAVELLQQILDEHDGEWMFPSTGPRNESGHLCEMAWYRRRWVPALERAGIPWMRLHALRATCATRMLEAGATIEEVRQQLGHSTLTMVLRYARLVESHLSDVHERMAQITRSTLQPAGANGSESGGGTECGSAKVVEFRKVARRKG